MCLSGEMNPVALARMEDKTNEKVVISSNKILHLKEDSMSVLTADTEEEEEEEECLEDLEIYRLDFEEPRGSTGTVRAAGGEALQAGDHVYMWCTMYQHHGIILEVIPGGEKADTSKNLEDGENSGSVLIAEFTNVALLEAPHVLGVTSTSSNAATVGVEGGFRIVLEKEPHKNWHKVKYGANPIESVTWRPGTCSSAEPSNRTLILTRVQFLKDCRHLIPDYHVLASNCETVAVWCVTGKWMTLQGDRALQLSQVGGALTSFVTLGLGVAAGGMAVWHSHRISGKCRETAALLNREFEWYSMGKTPEFSFQPSENQG